MKGRREKDCDINKNSMVEAIIIRTQKHSKQQRRSAKKTKEKLYCYLSSFVLCKQFKMSLLRKALQKKNKSRNSGDGRNNNTDTNIEPLEQQQSKIIYHEI